MDELEKQIKSFLVARRKGTDRHALDEWPTSHEFYLFIEDKLEGEPLKKMLNLLRVDHQAQEFVKNIRQLTNQSLEMGQSTVPQDLIAQAQALIGKNTSANCPHCGKAITTFKKPLKTQQLENGLWLCLLVGAFTLSFFFPRYFYQWLLLAALSGFKWALNSRATKTQIMIYKALKEDDNRLLNSQRIQEHLHQ